ncbi:MAG: zinc-ribbon domain-containing protein [Polyangiaceae bacterium]
MRRTNTTLGRLVRDCARCRGPSWMSYVRNKKWFTLFFIPVMPLGSTTYSICETCGLEQTVANPAEVDRALAARVR